MKRRDFISRSGRMAARGARAASRGCRNRTFISVMQKALRKAESAFAKQSLHLKRSKRSTDLYGSFMRIQSR